MANEDGGPAFASRTIVREEADISAVFAAAGDSGIFRGEIPKRQIVESTGGMSLRDWFAGQAIVGLLSDRQGYLTDHTVSYRARLPGQWASETYEIADAMIAERNRNSAAPKTAE